MELFLSCLHHFSLPLEDCICSSLIPKLLGQDIPGKLERELFSLPVWLGDLGLFAPTVTAAQQHQCSQVINSPLVALIVSQVHDAISCFAVQVQLCSVAHTTQRKELQDFANNIYSKLAPDFRSSVELACEKGASNSN